MTRRLGRGLAALTLSLAAACHSAPHDPAAVEAELRDALAAFEAAQRALDVDAVLGYLAEDFSMLHDGTRVDHAATVQQIRLTLPNLRAFEPRFEDIQVLVLGPDLALTSMTFRDAVTDALGVTHRQRGPSTLLWRRVQGDWRIVFADSDHYPDPASP